MPSAQPQFMRPVRHPAAEGKEGETAPTPGSRDPAIRDPAFAEAILPLRDLETAARRLSGPHAYTGPSRPLVPPLLQVVIDAMPFGLVFVDAVEGIVTRNEAANRLLAVADGLLLRQGSLAASLPEECKALRVLIREALSAGDDTPARSRILCVTRPSGRQPLILLAASLAFGAATGSEPVRLAMVLIGGGDELLRDQVRMLQRIFGLSLAEAEIAVALVEDTPTRVAELRRVSISTIRSQIKSVLGKTGARRQSDLVKLIARLPASLPLDGGGLGSSPDGRAGRPS